MKLEAQKRELLGKKVKKIRKENGVPASVYGPNRKSESITVDAKQFSEVFKKVAFNKFFDLVLDEGKAVKVLVKDVQIHPVKDYFISISFYQISEDRKLTVDVPLELEGESPAVNLNIGFLVQAMDTIKVHCLPKDIPAGFKIDISKLENTGDSIAVSSLKLEEGVEYDSSVDETSAIVYIAAKQKEEDLLPPTVEGEEGAEGEAAAEGAEAEAAEGSEEKAE